MAAEAVRWWVGAPGARARGRGRVLRPRRRPRRRPAGAGHRAGAGRLAHRPVVPVVGLRRRAGRRRHRAATTGRCAEQLLDDLLPLADTCAVNGALVCFMGAHAHRVGLLHAALGEPDAGRAGGCTGRCDDPPAARRPGLGGRDPHARAGRASTATRPAADRRRPDAPPGCARVGDMWQASYRGRTAYLRDAKGLHDLAALLARPGADVPALDLAGAPAIAGRAPAARTEPVLDRAALVGVPAAPGRARRRAGGRRGRRRPGPPAARHRRARTACSTELRRATRPGGASRALGPHRRRTRPQGRHRPHPRRHPPHRRRPIPDLGAHLDRTVRTGTTCRYDPNPHPY